MTTQLSTIQRFAQKLDVNQYSVLYARAASGVSIVAFATLAILWGNLDGISSATRDGLGMGALGALLLLGGSETLAHYWKRFDIIPSSEVKTKEDADGSYTGTFSSTGKPHGKGKYTFKSTGNVLVGTFDEGKLKEECEGHLLLKDGSTYKGRFSYAGGIPDGQGKLKDSTGNTFEGQFENGVFLAGTATFENGNSFKGSFENGKPSQGLFRLANHPTLRSFSGPMPREGQDPMVICLLKTGAMEEMRYSQMLSKFFPQNQ